MAIVAAISGAVVTRYEAPPARSDDAGFSATRARATLVRVLGTGAPRPTGSAANRSARAAILSELERLGVEADVEEGTACAGHGVCARVTNVIARLAGRQQGRAVVLAAHYDSVPAGAGVSDDLVAVASLLEIARVLKTRPPLRRPVWLLFTDGEELGLLGARLFVKGSHRAAAAFVVNLEARGTQGPSMMFETSTGNADLVRSLAGALDRPVTSSAFYAVYKRLPNDTDFSVFRRSGLRGVNFAFIGNVGDYHTPNDSLDNLSMASLQHHGDNALAMASALAADAHEPGAAADDAVFFDVLAACTVWWPAPWTWVFLAVSTLLVAAAIGRLLALGRVRPLEYAWGLAALVPALGLTALGATLFGVSLEAAGRVPTFWIATPGPAIAVCWSVGAAGVWTMGSVLRRRAGPEGLWAGTFTLLTVLAWLSALALPGVSFLFVVPTLAAGAAGVLWWPRKPATTATRSAAIAVPTAASAVVWLPVAWLLYDAVGLVAPAAIGITVAMAVSPMMAAIAALPEKLRWWPAIAAGATSFVWGAGALLVEPFTPESPQRLNIAYHERASPPEARWLLDASSGPVPAALRRAAAAGPDLIDPHPWAAGWAPIALAGPRPALGLAAPRANVASARDASGRRTVRINLSSRRGARLLMLHLPAEARVDKVRVMGSPVTPRPWGAWRVVAFAAPPAGGVDIDLRLRDDAPIDALISDHSSGLPDDAAPVLSARPANAVPSQGGDQTIVSASLRL